MSGVNEPYNYRKIADKGVYDPRFFNLEHQAIQRAIAGAQGDLGIFNASKYFKSGDSDDAASINRAIADAAKNGGTVLITAPKPTTASQIVVPASVQIAGLGSQATQLLSSYNGYTFLFGGLGGSVTYGNAIRDMAIVLSNTNGGAFQAIATYTFYAENLYIEGVVGGNCNGVFLDGGNAANGYSTLNSVDCNHTKIALRLGSTGALPTTSVTATAFNTNGDRVVGGKGVQVDATNGNGSRFFGGNFENHEIGVDLAGWGVQFFGGRFEINLNDVTLEAGAYENAFIGCSGLTRVTNSSGKTDNTFWANTKEAAAGAYPNTVGGPVKFNPGTAAVAPINVPSGVAPTSPVDGDMWYDGTNVKIRVGGVTKTFTIT